MFSATHSTLFTLICLTICYSITSAQDNPCARECMLGAPPMECHYTFTMEYYLSMSKACYSCPTTEDDCSRNGCVALDGYKRPIMTINRQIPAPKIEVCQGDLVVVDALNNLMSDSTSIHWHGQHQVATPYMDGLPFVSQCPILPGNTFTYRFTATQAGTHFYHSHSGLQRGDGLFGPFIVRRPPQLDPHRNLYDHDLSDHIMVINDWSEESSLESFLYTYHSGDGIGVTNILVNGKGRYTEFTADDDTTVYTPVERFYVERFQRYRFRVINNGVLACPIQISVDDHMLIIISSDGNDLTPTEADSLVLGAGERYDFILNADQPDDLYWMRFRGLMQCSGSGVSQVAVLHYQGAEEGAYPEGTTTYEDSEREGVTINAVAVGMESTGDDVSIGSLHSIQNMDPRLMGSPDFKYLVSFALNAVNNPMFFGPDYWIDEVDSNYRTPTAQINSVTMKFLPVPLLSGRASIQPNSFCNDTTLSDTCTEDFCGCTHVVQIPLNAVVELIFVDRNPFTVHPIHIHGISFRVVGMEYLGGTVTDDLILELDDAGALIRNFNHPPVKDTVMVPSTGYTIVRFIASNPGYWFMHCHLELHAAVGMGLVFKFGEDEDMVPVPSGFPECGDYDPATA